METRDAIAQRHMSQWDHYRAHILGPAIECGDEKVAKRAKIIADCLRIYHDGERRSCDYAAGSAQAEELSFGWQDAD